MRVLSPVQPPPAMARTTPGPATRRLTRRETTAITPPPPRPPPPQHVASRVRNLPEFVARANRQREATGNGLGFLRIPRSYYGVPWAFHSYAQ